MMAKSGAGGTSVYGMDSKTCRSQRPPSAQREQRYCITAEGSSEGRVILARLRRSRGDDIHIADSSDQDEASFCLAQ